MGQLLEQIEHLEVRIDKLYTKSQRRKKQRRTPKYRKYLKMYRKRFWWRRLKNNLEEKPMYNRYKGWEY